MTTEAGVEPTPGDTPADPVRVYRRAERTVFRVLSGHVLVGVGTRPVVAIHGAAASVFLALDEPRTAEELVMEVLAHPAADPVGSTVDAGREAVLDGLRVLAEGHLVRSAGRAR